MYWYVYFNEQGIVTKCHHFTWPLSLVALSIANKSWTEQGTNPTHNNHKIVKQLCETVNYTLMTMIEC